MSAFGKACRTLVSSFLLYHRTQSTAEPLQANLIQLKAFLCNPPPLNSYNIWCVGLGFMNRKGNAGFSLSRKSIRLPYGVKVPGKTHSAWGQGALGRCPFDWWARVQRKKRTGSLECMPRNNDLSGHWASGDTFVYFSGVVNSDVEGQRGRKRTEYWETENTGFLILSMRYNLLAHFQQPGLKGEHRKHT